MSLLGYGLLDNFVRFENEEMIVASERNLCNCVKKPEKKFRTSTGFVGSTKHNSTQHNSTCAAS